MQPVLTDNEIIASFTPTEHGFYRWFEASGYVHVVNEVQLGRSPSIAAGMQTAWPDVENAYQKWLGFLDKWIMRRSMAGPMSGAEFISLVLSTRCNDANEVSRYFLTFEVYDLEFVSLGASDFGGTFAEYMVWVDDCYLHPDSAPSELDEKPELHNRVMGIDFNNDFSAFLPNMQDDSEVLRVEKSSSAPELSITTQGANTNDNEPFYFFQIGSLRYDAGDGMIGPFCLSLNRGANYNQSTYGRTYHGECTDYEVVVQVGPDGFPTGAVYVMYNHESGVPHRFEKRLTLPGPLFRGSSPPFFLAKIADSVQDLNQPRVFDFEVVLKERRNVFRTKVDKASGKIVPDV
ncbi:hypothetical protein BGZ61DRAFT_527143 [Ilyonectria robusta]|uniref:uncharacterized protein n=1 Tax=Ilyonectria robusta TaxID=1079257 RepID=UPI001E8E367E|nr:uncharacterized protein BGZ61DRAFT_527143 [Ilyonectria robusta]KAH8736156.1 hypothetical protein BGZ61DRAFT_527143 [Ilyonectria robusta]